MTFINVQAYQCSQQGIVGNQTVPQAMRIHKDLIGAIVGQNIRLKDGNILLLGDAYFTRFTLVGNINLDTL